jgi:hypothetical protein
MSIVRTMRNTNIQGDQQVSVHLMITVQKNEQKYFKQFQSLTMITWLELGITDGVSVSLVSPWRVNKCLQTGRRHFENYL